MRIKKQLFSFLKTTKYNMIIDNYQINPESSVNSKCIILNLNVSNYQKILGILWVLNDLRQHIKTAKDYWDMKYEILMALEIWWNFLSLIMANKAVDVLIVNGYFICNK